MEKMMPIRGFPRVRPKFCRGSLRRYPAARAGKTAKRKKDSQKVSPNAVWGNMKLTRTARSAVKPIKSSRRVNFLLLFISMNFRAMIYVELSMPQGAYSHNSYQRRRRQEYSYRLPVRPDPDMLGHRGRKGTGRGHIQVSRATN